MLLLKLTNSFSEQVNPRVLSISTMSCIYNLKLPLHVHVSCSNFASDNDINENNVVYASIVAVIVLLCRVCTFAFNNTATIVEV